MQQPQNQELFAVTVEMYEAVDANGKRDGHIIVYDNAATGTHEEIWVPTEAEAITLFQQMNAILKTAGLKQEAANA